MATSVFSDYEIDELGIKFDGEEEYGVIRCIGSLEEEMNTRTISKKCRGITVKEITKGDGTGTVKISAHIPWDIYTKGYGMNLDTLIKGVKAYGRNSVHPSFSATGHVTDEDGVEKYKAYPKCVIKTGKAAKITNGEEEVAEVELEIGVTPDEYGNGVYEALASELEDASVKAAWMNAFTPELVQSVTTA